MAIYRVFLSHGGGDSYLVQDWLVPKLTAAGASVFIDLGEIQYGDDFKARIFQELSECHELIVLLTPTSVQRPWIFAELGVAISRKIRVVALIYGVPETDLQAKGVLSLLGTNNYLPIDKTDSYVSQLKSRANGEVHV